MGWSACLPGRGLPLADVGPGPLIYPAGGSAALAGLCLALAVVAGGLWLARRSRGQPDRVPRKVFWVSLGVAAVLAAASTAVVGLFVPPALIATLMLLVAGTVLIGRGVRGPRPAGADSVVPPEGGAQPPRTGGGE
jgi:hypothetical protein